MATSFTYVVFPHHKRADGSFAVKIRMIHNRKAKYMTTSICVTKAQLTRNLNKITDIRVLEQVNEKIKVFRETVGDIAGAEFIDADELWTEILERIKCSGVWHLDFFDFAEEKMANMEAKTAEGYRTSLHALQRFIHGCALDINQINYRFLVQFRNFLENEPALSNGKGQHAAKGKGSRAISYYLSCLRALHNMARDEYNDEDEGIIRIPRQPFKPGLIPKQPQTKHRTLTVEQMKAIAGTSFASGSRAELARDVFLLSFFLIGENTVDLYHAGADELKDGIQTYNRRKTDSVRCDNALMRVRIEGNVEELIRKYKDRTGERMFCFHLRYSDHRGFNVAVNKGLKDVAKAVNDACNAGLPEDLNFYYARHTWSTLAHSACGVDFDTIHQALNHARRGEDRVTGIYVEKDWQSVWEANRKVLEIVLG